MKMPKTHERQHELWRHRWNPYKKRDSQSHELDKCTFQVLLGTDYPHDFVSAELFVTGCLDAPEEIPLGGTASVMTVGGYWREEYLHMGREYDDWNGYQKAVRKVAGMLREILAIAA